MASDDPSQCSHCGSSSSVDVRYVACVATSEWNQNNYPAPNTTMNTKDDIRLWKIPLCATCIPSSYRTYLSNLIGKMETRLVICSIALVTLILFTYFNISSYALANSNILMDQISRLVLVVFIMMLIVFGVGGVPFYAVKLIINFARLKSLDNKGVVPPKQIDKSFIGEGQRILKALAPQNGEPEEKIVGDFPLPEHKLLDQTTRDKLNLLSGIHERDIIAVGKTIDELEKKLLPEWKTVWEQYKLRSSEIDNPNRAVQIVSAVEPKVINSNPMPNPSTIYQPLNCPYCARQLPKDKDDFCTYCGNKLPQESLNKPAASNGTVLLKDGVIWQIRCNNCGTINELDAIVCEKCAKQLR
jgi:hypothetical protein